MLNKDNWLTWSTLSYAIGNDLLYLYLHSRWAIKLPPMFRELFKCHLLTIFHVNSEPDYCNTSFSQKILFFEALWASVTERCFFLICEDDLFSRLIRRFISNLAFRTHSATLNILLSDDVFCEVALGFSSNPLIIIGVGHSTLRWSTLGIKLIHLSNFCSGDLLTALLDRYLLFFLHNILLTWLRLHNSIIIIRWVSQRSCCH